MKILRISTTALSSLLLGLGLSSSVQAQNYDEGLIPIDNYERQLLDRQRERIAQMSPAEREAVLERQKMLYQRWSNMPDAEKEQLRDAKRNMYHLWNTMSPQEKERLRQSRFAMREKLKNMAPEQRQEYLNSHRNNEMEAMWKEAFEEAEKAE